MKKDFFTMTLPTLSYRLHSNGRHGFFSKKLSTSPSLLERLQIPRGPVAPVPTPSSLFEYGDAVAEDLYKHQMTRIAWAGIITILAIMALAILFADYSASVQTLSFSSDSSHLFSRADFETAQIPFHEDADSPKNETDPIGPGSTGSFQKATQKNINELQSLNQLTLSERNHDCGRI